MTKETYHIYILVYSLECIGYNLGTPALKPYKREIKLYQNDTVLQEKTIQNRTCNELEKEFE